MFDSFTQPASVAQDIIRTLFSTLDRPAYAILGVIYELFFNVATADLFSNEIIMKFYGRVQVILGVFMMFQLAMTILRGIVNPDSFTKDKGVGTLITRIITALILITLLMPISTSGGNEYEKQINNNGLLFGTLYSLQHRILSNNTIGRLVLGTNESNTTFSDTATNGDSDLKKSARIFTSTVLKGFYRINLVPEDQRKNTGDGKDPAVYNENRVCTDIDDSILSAYTRVDAEPGEIIGMVNATCESTASPSFLNSLWSGAKKLTGSTKYVFAYTPLVSTIVAVVFIFILLSFTIDVAVRAVKLAVLRLIAPIPIIGYMDPKGGKDSSFNAWVKAVTSTYLDLFIRLASVYFVIFLIQDMIVNGVSISTTAGSGFIHTLSLIIIWVGLFVFAKQAPKFIREVLGLKGDAPKLFSGFSEIMAVGAVGASTVGGAVSRGIATAAHTTGNAGKKIVSGIAGGIAGGISGGTAAAKTFWNQKDYDSKAIMNQVRANNAKNYSNAADESTPFGRFWAGAQANIGLQNKLQQYDEKAKYYGAAKDALGRMNDAFNSNGDYKSEYSGPDIKDGSGQTVLKSGESYSLKDYKDKLGRVQASGNESLIKSVDDAMKKAQGQRLDELRTTFTGATREEARNKLIAEIERTSKLDSSDPDYNKYTQRDLDVFDGAYTIYNVSQKYSSEPMFADYKGKSFSDTSVSWGKMKRAASTAGDTAKSLKASPEYDRAKANAARASEQKK